MKRFLFVITYPWEVGWLAPVVMALPAENAVVWAGDTPQWDDVYWGTPGRQVTTIPEYDILVVCQCHMGESPARIREANQQGKPVIELQYAWDSALHLRENLWGMDMRNCVDLFCVAGSQDEEFLKPIFGDRVIATGCPRFDVIHRMVNCGPCIKDDILFPNLQGKWIDGYFYKYPPKSKDDLYFAATEVIGQDHYDHDIHAYYTMLSGMGERVKMLGHNGAGSAWVYEHFPQLEWVKMDNWRGLLKTHEFYELIFNAEALITSWSSMIVEATLLGVPVVQGIAPTQAAIEANWVDRNQDRIPENFFSTTESPEFTEGQRKLCEWYLADGKSTQRVVELLEAL